MRTITVSYNVYITSKVGAEGMGLLNLTSTVYGFAITFATSGINLAVVRLVSGALPYENESYFDKVANKRVHKIMCRALMYCLFFSVIASFVLYISSGNIGRLALGDVRTIPALKILSFTLVPISISSALNGYFCAVRRVYKNVIVQVCEQGAKITIVTSLLVLIAPKGLEYACIAVVAGGAISEAICVLLSSTLYFFDRHIHKRYNNEEKENVKPFRGFSVSKEKIIKGKDSVVSIALPVAISAYMRSFLLTIEHLAIPWGLKRSGASSTSALSSYGVLHGMVFPILLFPSAVLSSFSSLLIPELSSAKEQGDTKRIRRIVSKVFYFSIIFSVCVAGIFVCFSYEIGSLLYGSKEASEFIRLLSPLIPLMYLDTAVDSMLKGLGEQLYTMRVNIADSFLSVILVIVLIPNMGIYGYVVVIFLMELFNTSLSIIKLLNITKIDTPIKKWIIKPLLCIIGSTIIARLIFNFDFIYNLLSAFLNSKILAIFEICFTAILYLVLSKLSGAIGKDEISFAKGLIRA